MNIVFPDTQICAYSPFIPTCPTLVFPPPGYVDNVHTVTFIHRTLEPISITEEESSIYRLALDNLLIRTDQVTTGATPTSAATATFTATATSTPTATLLPTIATAQAAISLSTVFPPPMNVPSPRLSDTNADTHVFPPNPSLCSRDINPEGVVGGNHPVVASSAGSVIVVDDMTPGSVGDNTGLGRFVAIRLPIVSLPSQIKTILAQTYPTTASFVNSNTGYLHVGYGHLNSIAAGLGISVAALNPTLGMSGKTGLEANPSATEHLDVSVYFVSDDGTEDADPALLGGVDWHQRYFNIFINTDGRYGVTQAIDPLTLWPVLAFGWSNIVSC